MPKMSLSDALLESNTINYQQLKEAEQKQIGAKRPLQDILIDMGYITEDDLLNVLSRTFNINVDNKYFIEKDVDPVLVNTIPYEIANSYGVFPLYCAGDDLFLAMSNPVDIDVLTELKVLTNYNIKPVLARKSTVASYINEYYSSDNNLYDLLKNKVEDTKIEIISGQSQRQDGYDINNISTKKNAPVIRLINFILSNAVKSRASDVHIEPQGEYIEIRFRIDGELKEIAKLPGKLGSSLLARVKVMSNLDIAETKKAQDGRIKISAYNRDIDLRISIIPTFHGEKAVIRLLDPREAKIDINTLGMSDKDIDNFKECLSFPQGMILSTGPTGSGKTSTLYAALEFIKDSSKNIITIEDPIEYLIDGINQIQVNPIKNITFSEGLRSILRQDPNIILVGEIRDEETADIAFRASLTGHLVFSTLHTNSAVASIDRILDLGIDAHILSSSMLLIVAQRLVRCICENCKSEYTPEERILKEFDPFIKKYNIDKFYHGNGCLKCNNTGFLGRTGLFEMLRFNDVIKDMVINRAKTDSILKEARDQGLTTLFESGIEMIQKQITTFEEVRRVVDVSKEVVDAHEQRKRSEKIKILAADDEEFILRLIETRLTKAGYEVIKALDGEEAYNLALKEKPDLAIVDIMMPKLDGFGLTKKLKSNLETAFIPIMMLTALKDLDSEVKGIDVGADDYMTKPFDGTRLLARVNMLLRRNKV